MNLRRTAALAGIGALSLAFVAMYERPHAAPPPREQASMVHAYYAAPVEAVETHRLGEGETLGALLARASIDGVDLTDLLLTLRERRNPRTLRPGVEVTVRRWVATGAPRAVEVRLNPDTTVRLDRGDAGWASRVLLTETHLDTVFAAGRIDSGRTLYESIAEDDNLTLPLKERVELVGQLATVFEYQLDFSREIQPGDTYRFVYEREARPDGSARSRRILAAEVRSQGKPYTAFYFASGGASAGGYYDATGKSLKGSMSRYPIDFVRITSRFSWRRYHPVLGIFRAHLGTDFGAAIGTPVKVTSDGVVTSVGWEGGYGNMVVVRHANGYTTRYGHLSRFGRGLRRGKKVSQGQVIAYVGSTGLSTGPHLHYEIRDATGRAVDLSRGKSRLPSSGVLNAKSLRIFKAVVQERLALLEQATRQGGAYVARAPEPGARVDVHGVGK
jgi:murein DD-endopeptidase MepM/ murein hydrolase activator NlpD